MTSARAALVTTTMALAVLASPSPAEACSCIGPGPSSAAFRSADLVFIGTVTRVDSPKPTIRTNPDGSTSLPVVSSVPAPAAFDVASVFKGESTRQVTVAGEICGVPFTPGETWLVYAALRDGRVTASVCSRSRLRASAEQDLVFLEGLEQGRRQGIVYGEVHRRITGPDGAPVRQALFEPLQVIAAGAGRRFTVTTDKWGPYQLVLPPGEFEIWVEREGKAVSPRQKVQIEHGSEQRIQLVVDFPGAPALQHPSRHPALLAGAR